MSNDLAQSGGMDLQQADAISRLPPEMMLLKMENESIMAVARTTPRDPMKIVEQLRQLLEAYPGAAEKAIYSKPVGTVTEIVCGNPKCGIRYEVNAIDAETCCPACDSKVRGAARKVKKFAEGLSIRSAEDIRSIYGYTRMATTTTILEDGKAKLTGVLVDYAAGNVTSDERIVSPMYKARGGGMVRTPEDRFLNVVVKSEKSKLRRDVILDNTPSIVKAMYRDLCERKMADLVKPEVIEQKVIPAFAEYGVTRDHLDKIVGRPHKLGWREADRLQLRKILTALRNSETTPQELLAGLEDVAPESQPKTGATMDDLTKPPAPDALDVSSEATTESPTPEPPKPDVHADAVATSDDDLLNEYWGLTRQATDAAAVNDLTLRYASALQSPEAKQKAATWGRERVQELAPKRGPGRPRKDSGQLFDGSASATESGA
jgi:hypothetical protein